jgi:integrase
MSETPTLTDFSSLLLTTQSVRCLPHSHADGQKFGLHNLRHPLSNWLVKKAKVEPKTVQSILRHSRIQTTLDIYTQGDGDETRAAQGAFLKELGMASEMIQ